MKFIMSICFLLLIQIVFVLTVLKNEWVYIMPSELFKILLTKCSVNRKYFLIIFIWYQYFTILEVGRRHKIKNCIEQFKHSVHFKLSINNRILTDLMNWEIWWDLLFQGNCLLIVPEQVKASVSPYGQLKWCHFTKYNISDSKLTLCFRDRAIQSIWFPQQVWVKYLK